MLELLQLFATQAALAIAHARLYEETLRGKEYLGTILEINKKIGMATQTSELLQTIAEEAARLLQVDAVGFRLVEGEFLVSAAMTEMARQTMLRPRLRIGESLSGQVVAENRPLIVPDIATASSSWIKEHQEAALRQGITSLMIVPVRIGNRVIGVLIIHTKGNRQFTQQDLDVAMAFADQAGIAIERTRLLQETETKAGNLRAVIEVGKALSSALELEAVLQTIVASAVEVLKASSGNVMLLDETGEELHWKAQVGFPAAYQQIGRSKVRASLAGCVITEGRPVAVVDRTGDPRTAHPDLAKENELISFLGVPIHIKERIVGVITISTKEPRRYTDDDISLLSISADQAAVAIENARLFAETRRLANTDELTGLYNHRHFYHLFNAEVNRAHRYNRPLSLIMIDLDRFKQFNDQYGHLAGDEALRRLAQILRWNARGVDMVSRYGGEEFTIILPETDLDQATIQAERIRSAVAEYHWPQGRLTISLGVASLTSEMAKVEDLVQAADQALYQAKAGGRNRVSPGKPPSR
jgi:diguanylate cyclase (GGDEF)-like protein